MLLTSMDVDAAHEIDFNRWYDREHLAERVSISGFIEARRYLSESASPKYLSTYSTHSFDVLDGPAYRAALANQTPWSKANIARFRNMIRAVTRVTVSVGQGRGAALGLVRIRPDLKQAEGLRDHLRRHFDPHNHDGVIAMHLLESNPDLSRSLTDPAAIEGAADWFILIDATTPGVAGSISASHFLDGIGFARLVSSGVYNLLFDLAATDV